MEALNDGNPNVLLKYVNVRNPKKYENTEPNVGSSGVFVVMGYESLSPAQLAVLEVEENLLYTDILVYKGQPDAWGNIKDKMQDYKAGDFYISNIEILKSTYEQLDEIYEWINANQFSMTKTQLIDKIEDVGGDTLSNIVANDDFLADRMRLWDNFLIHVFDTLESSVINTIGRYLIIIKLIERLEAEDADLVSNAQLRAAYKTRCLIPVWLFDAIKETRPVDNEVGGLPAPDPKGVQQGLLKSRYAKLNKGVKEIDTLMELKANYYRNKSKYGSSGSSKSNKGEAGYYPGTIGGGNKSGIASGSGSGSGSGFDPCNGSWECGYHPPIAPDHTQPTHSGSGASSGAALPTTGHPTEIKQDEVDYDVLTCYDFSFFSQDTKDILEEIMQCPDEASARYARSKFVKMANETVVKIEGKTHIEFRKIGSSWARKDEICNPIIDINPCAGQSPASFISKGSFYNSAVMGDLLITKQYLIKYELGEVAHIESIMDRLIKERTHRRLNRTEQTNIFERQSTNETERETQTTERFSMEKETSNVVSQDIAVTAGLNVSADLGTVQLNTNLGFSYGYSEQTSVQEASAYSKDVTTRALQRVKEFIREQQTVTVINEVEETSLHRYENTGVDSNHVNGVYRWVDKYYLNKIINYGNRLMYEFTIPEPANFYIYRKFTDPNNSLQALRPVHPKDVTDSPDGALTNFLGLTETNYAWWCTKYGVTDIALYPPATKTISTAISLNTTDGGDKAFADPKAFIVPLGYKASLISVEWEYITFDSNHVNYGLGIRIMIGGFISTPYLYGWETTGSRVIDIENNWTPVRYANGDAIPFAVKIWHDVADRDVWAAVTVDIKCDRTEIAENEWKVSTYNKILEAYNKQLRDYNDAVNSRLAYDNVVINGNNPEINRQIEKEELKKRCIEMFTGQRFGSFDAAVNANQSSSSVPPYPEILFNESIKEGNTVKFIEQAFEWHNITYIFYPYFYGKKSSWQTIKKFEDKADPIFTQFLQSGYARVVIPVKPGFEDFVMIFSKVSNTFGGSGWPFSVDLFGNYNLENLFGVEDETYMSIAAELAARDELKPDPVNEMGLDNIPPVTPPGAPQVGDNVVDWYVQKVPTNLVYIFPNGADPDATPPGLPDNSGDDNIEQYLS